MGHYVKPDFSKTLVEEAICTGVWGMGVTSTGSEEPTDRDDRGLSASEGRQRFA